MQFAKLLVRRLFINHLRTEKIGYIPHLQRSMTLACAFCAAGLRAAVHAVIPGIFVKSSTTAIERELPELLRSMKGST